MMTSAAPALRHSSATATAISGLVHSPLVKMRPDATQGMVTMLGLMNTVSSWWTTSPMPPRRSRAWRVMLGRSVPRTADTGTMGSEGPGGSHGGSMGWRGPDGPDGSDSPEHAAAAAPPTASADRRRNSRRLRCHITSLPSPINTQMSPQWVHAAAGMSMNFVGLRTPPAVAAAEPTVAATRAAPNTGAHPADGTAQRRSWPYRSTHRHCRTRPPAVPASTTRTCCGRSRSRCTP